MSVPRILGAATPEWFLFATQPALDCALDGLLRNQSHDRIVAAFRSPHHAQGSTILDVR